MLNYTLTFCAFRRQNFLKDRKATDRIYGKRKVLIPQEEIAKQYNYMEQIRLLNEGKELYAVVKTYGCQQNKRPTLSVLPVCFGRWDMCFQRKRKRRI